MCLKSRQECTLSFHSIAFCDDILLDSVKSSFWTGSLFMHETSCMFQGAQIFKLMKTLV